jgi:hypothetical protein
MRKIAAEQRECGARHAASGAGETQRERQETEIHRGQENGHAKRARDADEAGAVKGTPRREGSDRWPQELPIGSHTSFMSLVTK